MEKAELTAGFALMMVNQPIRLKIFDPRIHDGYGISQHVDFQYGNHPNDAPHGSGSHSCKPEKKLIVPLLLNRICCECWGNRHPYRYPAKFSYDWCVQGYGLP